MGHCRWELVFGVLILADHWVSTQMQGLLLMQALHALHQGYDWVISMRQMTWYWGGGFKLCTVRRGCCVTLVKSCVHGNFGSSFAPHTMGNGMVVSSPHLHTILYSRSYKIWTTMMYDSESLTTLNLRLSTLHLAFLDFGCRSLLNTFHS